MNPSHSEQAPKAQTPEQRRLTLISDIERIISAVGTSSEIQEILNSKAVSVNPAKIHDMDALLKELHAQLAFEAAKNI